MAGTGAKIDSLRLNRFETKRLAWALALSVAAHLLIWGGFELGKKYQLWQRFHLPARLMPTQKKSPPPVAQETEPTMFLDVDPDQVSPDAPKDAKYYSAKNSRAANPDAERDSKQPKLNGKQADVPKVRDVPRTPITKPQPAPALQTPQKEQQASPPKPTEEPGETKLAKLEMSPQKKETPEKPRTLNEARAQQQALRPSRQMLQDGGVLRRMSVAALDSKATPFGEYDQALVDAVSQCWFDYLEKNSYAFDRLGVVIVAFRLHSDGRVTDLRIVQDTVDDKAQGIWAYLCQASVEKAAPFAPWPSDLVRLNNANYRDVKFRFIY